MKKFNIITISLLSLSLLGACSNSNSMINLVLQVLNPRKKLHLPKLLVLAFRPHHLKKN